MTEENQKAIKSFLDSKKGNLAATQKHYRVRLDILSKYLNKKKISISKFNQDNLIQFFSYNYDKYKPKTMNHLKAVVSQFLKFQYPKNWISRFPNLANICKGQAVKQKYETSQMLSLEDFKILIQREPDPYWKLVIAMQFYGGCRPTEICLLKWKDITFDNEGVYFSIYSAKNNKRFEKFVPLEYSSYLKELKKTSKSDYCFTRDGVRPINQNILYKHLIKLSQKALSRKVNPYLLRHSIATILYGKAEKGELNDDVVARQMAHTKNMKDTYAHFNIETLRRAAKSIYVNPDYTPEQKADYDKQLAELKDKLESMETYIGLKAFVTGKEVKGKGSQKEFEEYFKALNEKN